MSAVAADPRPSIDRQALTPIRALIVLAWLAFISEVIIVGTGGAVRLTDSGLGCSQWPLCTPESLVPTRALGIHGFIEFGNRTMTGVLSVLALAVLFVTLGSFNGRRAVRTALIFATGSVVAAALVFAIVKLAGGEAFPFAVLALLVVVIAAAIVSSRQAAVRRDLVILAWIAFIGIVAQAFVGGIIVITGLNPFIVGFHYVSSLLLVCLTAVFLVRSYEPVGPRERAVPTWFLILTHVTSLVLTVTIFFGVLTTGNGPHSGDANVKRNGFDASVLAHIHSLPGYALFTLVLLLLVAAWAKRLRPRKWLTAQLALLLVQIAVGVWQARNGLPPLLVGVHMVLAVLSAACFTVVVLRLKRPARR
ncbi:MAG: COX15/CtaA family protein [Microbacterium sp.]